jgi:hypothetical protein
MSEIWLSIIGFKVDFSALIIFKICESTIRGGKLRYAVRAWHKTPWTMLSSSFAMLLIRSPALKFLPG